MPLRRVGASGFLGMLTLLAACTATITDSRPPDGAAPDLTQHGAATAEAGDGTARDDAAMPPDAAADDAAADDASLDDAGRADDAGVTDAATSGDAAAADAGSTVDAGTGDASAGDAGAACPARPYLGLYVWSDSLVTRRDTILDLAATQGVTEIYLHANLFYAGDVAESMLAAWIRAANARCIEVDLLFGNAAWIRPATQFEATARTRWAVAFADAHPDARPSGVHFDLEPQQLPEWDVRADRPLWIATLAALLETMTPLAEAGGLPLSLDMGFFLDGYDVTRGAVTRLGHEWLTDAVSRVVVMDYRDSAESMGFGGMISLATREVTYASSAGTPIVLAVETRPESPEYITFYEEGLAALRTELALTRTAFAAEPAFRGFAIHDEDGLAALPP
jgi:hypothetical protein